jgi:hypothetical protein
MHSLTVKMSTSARCRLPWPVYRHLKPGLIPLVIKQSSAASTLAQFAAFVKQFSSMEDAPRKEAAATMTRTCRYSVSAARKMCALDSLRSVESHLVQLEYRHCFARPRAHGATRAARMRAPGTRTREPRCHAGALKVLGVGWYSFSVGFTTPSRIGGATRAPVPRKPSMPLASLHAGSRLPRTMLRGNWSAHDSPPRTVWRD